MNSMGRAAQQRLDAGDDDEAGAAADQLS